MGEWLRFDGLLCEKHAGVGSGRFKACVEEVYRIFLRMFEGRGGTTLKGTTHRTRHIDRLNKNSLLCRELARHGIIVHVK